MQTVASGDLSHVPHLPVRTKRLCLTLTFFLPASVQLNQRGVSVVQLNGVAVWPPRPTASTWAAGVDIFAVREPRVSAADHLINHPKTSVPNRHPLARCSNSPANHPTSKSRLEATIAFSSSYTSLLHSLLSSLADKLSSPHGVETSLWTSQNIISWPQFKTIGWGNAKGSKHINSLIQNLNLEFEIQIIIAVLLHITI